MTRRRIRRIQRFYEDHRQSLYAYAVSIAGNRTDAEDAIHTAFARVLQQADAPRELRPYLFRAVRNAAIDGRRSRAHYANAPVILNEPATSNGLFHGFTAMDVESALQRLGEEERETIVLKIFSGFTFRELAALQDAPLNTVAARYRRALQKMRDTLEEDSNA